jgi:putative transposase
MPFLLDVVEQALGVATPQILNSGQGSLFASQLHTLHAEWAGVQIGMDEKGRALDNIMSHPELNLGVRGDDR